MKTVHELIDPILIRRVDEILAGCDFEKMTPRHASKLRDDVAMILQGFYLCKGPRHTIEQFTVLDKYVEDQLITKGVIRPANRLRFSFRPNDNFLNDLK